MVLGVLFLLLAKGSGAFAGQNFLTSTAQGLARERLLESGKSYYQAGRYSEAARVWQQAAVAYRDRKELLNQATSLNYLSNAYQELGQWEVASEAIANSLNLLQDRKKLDLKGIGSLAQSLMARGHLQLATGQPQIALETWERAETVYARAGNQTGQLGSRINQAIALQTLGLYKLAKTTLERVNEQLQTQPNSQLKVTGLRNLGRTIERVGDLSTAQKILEQSLTIAQEIGIAEDPGIALVNLGNIARNLRQKDEALTRYQEAIDRTNSNLVKTQAKLNQLRLLVENQQWEQAYALLPEIRSHLRTLPPSRPTIYARVNFADSLMEMADGRWQMAEGFLSRGVRSWELGEYFLSRGVGSWELGENSAPSLPTPLLPVWEAPSLPAPHSWELRAQGIAQILAIAIQQARELADTKAEAFALTQLGELYEQSGQWQDARQLTQKALQIAESINAEDIIARASWQLGRLLKQTGDIEGAIAAYTKAFNTLQSLRNDLIAMNPNVQFDFRDNVEPVYRELVGLLLLPDSVSQETLLRAREVIEALQLAEIENFLRDTCLIEKRPPPVQLEEIDPHAAVIYPIILSDRTEVIFSIDGRLQRHTINRPQTEVESVLKQLYGSFNGAVFIPEYQKIARQVYDWLIRPLETQLAENSVKTLVFVPDGFLRNLPMGALYDGRHYLLEKYAIATSAGLQLLPARLPAIAPRQIETLMAGVSKERPGFGALPGVARELRQLQKTIAGARVLLNEQFTKSAFIEEVDSSPLDLIHIATHGQFSPIPEETFLLTWDGNLNIKELGDTLERHQFNNNKPIELLVLSACQTASGDERSLLGLAGLALKSGAASTVGTLWIANDTSTARLMIDLYQQIADHPEQTKAESLRRAQLNLLKQRKYKHPFYWAPFTLIGNWS